VSKNSTQKGCIMFPCNREREFLAPFFVSVPIAHDDDDDGAIGFLGDNKESEPRLGGVGGKRRKGVQCQGCGVVAGGRGVVGWWFSRGCQRRAWLRFVWLSSAHFLRFANFLLSLLMSCLWPCGCESFCGQVCVRVLQPQPVGRVEKKGGRAQKSNERSRGRAKSLPFLCDHFHCDCHCVRVH